MVLDVVLAEPVEQLDPGAGRLSGAIVDVGFENCIRAAAFPLQSLVGDVTLEVADARLQRSERKILVGRVAPKSVEDDRSRWFVNKTWEEDVPVAGRCA